MGDIIMWHGSHTHTHTPVWLDDKLQYCLQNQAFFRYELNCCVLPSEAQNESEAREIIEKERRESHENQKELKPKMKRRKGDREKKTFSIRTANSAEFAWVSE